MPQNPFTFCTRHIHLQSSLHLHRALSLFSRSYSIFWIFFSAIYFLWIGHWFYVQNVFFIRHVTSESNRNLPVYSIVLCINVNDVGFCVKWQFWRQLSFTHFNSNDVYLFYVDDFFPSLRLPESINTSSMLINIKILLKPIFFNLTNYSIFSVFSIEIDKSKTMITKQEQPNFIAQI